MWNREVIQINTKQFLTELYGSCESGWLTLWTKQDKKTAWLDVTNHDLIADTAQSVEQDIYFGVGISNQRKDQGRITADEVDCIPGIWMDVDGKDDTHPNNPEDINILANFMSKEPLEPTILVNSGHGLHAYWLFKEP